MRIYIMRHGTTVWNEKEITQGRSQNRLSIAGKSLAEEVSLKNKNTKFDIIISSPLMRTMQTSNIMNKYHKVKILKDERLTELDKGIFTGRKKESLTKEELELKKTLHPSTKIESKDQVYARVKSFVDHLKEIKNYDNILVVTHAIVANLMCDILNNQEIQLNHYRSNFKNCEIRCFEI